MAGSLMQRAEAESRIGVGKVEREFALGIGPENRAEHVIICWHTLLPGEATEVGMHKQAGKRGGKRGKAEADTLDKERHNARHSY
jgi:hypothetical protein